MATFQQTELLNGAGQDVPGETHAAHDRMMIILEGDFTGGVIVNIETRLDENRVWQVARGADGTLASFILPQPNYNLVGITRGSQLRAVTVGGDESTKVTVIAVESTFSDGTMAALAILASTVNPLGGQDVNVQDQTTPPIDSLFAQQVSNFTLAVDTIASGIGVLQYEFTASPGHGLAVTSPKKEILLLDTIGNRSFFAEVVDVAGDVITVDRPIDHVFPSATALGRIVTTQMAVAGSLAAPQIFTIRAGQLRADHVRFIMTMLDGTSMDDGKFGGLGPLLNGLVFRILNGFQKTIFCFKTNGEISQFCYDTKYPDKAPAGQFGFGARISFGGQDKHGVVLRLGENDVLQWIVQDPLQELDSLKISAQGHEVD